MRAVIADDSVLLRGASRACSPCSGIPGEAGIETCALVGDGEALEQAVAEHLPDVALVDIRMPPTFTHEPDPRRARRRAPRGRGLTNGQIADRLFISPATAKTHLVHVYAKLGYGSRLQLVAEAVRRGIEMDQPAG